MKIRNCFLNAIDRVATSAKNLVNGLSDSFESIDFDSQFDSLLESKDSLIEKGNSLFKDFGDLLKQIKDCVTDFSVTVPFDEASGDKYSYEIKDGNVTIEVKFVNGNTSRTNTTTVAIPENCDLDKASVSTDTKKKTLTITIPKIRAVEKPKKAKKPGKPFLKRDSKGRFVKES